MAANTETKPHKGKTVGLWVSGEVQKALEILRDGNDYFREGTYAYDALIQRMQREGLLNSTGADSEVASQAFELAQSLGAKAVKAALTELAAKHAEAVPA